MMPVDACRETKTVDTSTTSSRDDVVVKYVIPVLANQHSVLGCFFVVARGCLFLVLFLVTFVGR